jgi:glutamate-1-semialdehyde 2,1-aminomutase
MNNDQIAEYLLRWTPGGSQTGSKAPGKAGPRGGGYPSALRHGSGARVWDYSGHGYIDFVGSLAAVALGHAYGPVVAAVERQLRLGSLLSLPTRLEGEASESLCDFLGWPEQVRWVKTGSEACEAAARVARCATGRKDIMTVRAGYHGWHSWFQAVKPQHPGVPDCYGEALVAVDYGDRELVAQEFAVGDIAAVLLEPAPITGGGSGDWLRWLVEEAHEAGALVIFDETVWGFRLSDSGGTGYFGVQPDLAVYGKALGNGIPVAALVGPRWAMQHATVVSGTYGGDALGLAAAVAVMEAYRALPVAATLWTRGEALCAGLRAIAEGAVGRSLGMSVGGYPVHPVVAFDPGALPMELLDRQGAAVAVMSLFLQELADRGVLFHPGGLNTIYSHSEADVTQALHEASWAAQAALRALHEGRLGEALRGEPYQQAFARAR